MTRLRIPRGAEWEILVVNNNCNDNTDEVIASFANRLPVQRVFEATPGHSHARNRAVTEAAGDLIVWTDDDVLVDPNWLTGYAEALPPTPKWLSSEVRSRRGLRLRHPAGWLGTSEN
jgi:glycosyltransferase involved in cell wall biosynthesis